MIGKLANQIASETTERNLYQLASAKCFELAGALELRLSPLPSYLSLLCHGLRPVCHRVLSLYLSIARRGIPGRCRCCRPTPSSSHGL